MQSVTGSVSSSSQRPGWELVARVFRVFAGKPTVDRPAMRWAEMKSIDFEGEDTSLTEAQLKQFR